MKHRILLLAPLVFIASCARFPDGGSAASRFPRIHFEVQMLGAINDTRDDTPISAYDYYVAIRTIKTEDVPNVGAPVPVIGEEGNGFVAGSPTHYVIYDSTQPYPYRLFRFNPSDDPTNPAQATDLTQAADTVSIRGPIINFRRPSDFSNKNVLSFDLFLNQLANTDEEAKDIKKIQFNFLTMNKSAALGTTNRYWDALGKSDDASEINTTITIDLRTNYQITNGLEGSVRIEPTYDVSEPRLDIQNFTVTVTQP